MLTVHARPDKLAALVPGSEKIMRTRRWSSKAPLPSTLRSVPPTRSGIFGGRLSAVTRKADNGRCSGDQSTRHCLPLRGPAQILVVVLLGIMAVLLSGCGQSEAEERNGAGVVRVRQKSGTARVWSMPKGIV